MDQKSIKEYIRALEHMTGFLRSLLEEELKNPPVPEDEKQMLSEITNLRLLAKSAKWPIAIPDDLICGDDEDQKLSRAAGLVNDFINTDLTEKNFIDFGCGEGHCPYLAANLVGVKLACGYDLYDQNWSHFEEVNNLKFTNSFKEVQEYGPFDVILINDVLDHCKDPSEVLKQAKSIKSDVGRIYVRCHPWTSRHGGHLYKQLNRAYLHLVFNEDELYAMGLKPDNSHQIIDPLKTYHKIIEESGLSISSEDIIRQPVDLFFTHEQPILRRIKSQWANSDDANLANGQIFPRDVLEIQFVDYILT